MTADNREHLRGMSDSALAILFGAIGALALLFVGLSFLL